MIKINGFYIEINGCEVAFIDVLTNEIYFNGVAITLDELKEVYELAKTFPQLA